jgi:hypothetical protein
MYGRRFTWSKEQVRSTLCRLDRVLYNDEWHDVFCRAMTQAISSSVSDNAPLVQSMDADFKPNGSFRFETFWAQRPDFLEQVQLAWRSTPFDANPFLVLNHKLKFATKVEF